MSFAILIPYRPDTPQRVLIHQTTQRLWARLDVEVCVADDGLDGPLFSYARAANRARRMTDAASLIVYNCDALPLSAEALRSLNALLESGTPWSAIFAGQRRFTQEQTDRLIDGAEPDEVGEPAGERAIGREALMAVRADVWDSLRGMDERFVGWGPEDRAWFQVLSTVYPNGRDFPEHGLFKTLWHPTVSMARLTENSDLWKSYPGNLDAEAMRAWYLSRPE